MIDINKLSNMVKKLKDLELTLDNNDWQNEDDIYEYNILQDQILNYLKKNINDTQC